MTLGDYLMVLSRIFSACKHNALIFSSLHECHDSESCVFGSIWQTGSMKGGACENAEGFEEVGVGVGGWGA